MVVLDVENVFERYFFKKVFYRAVGGHKRKPYNLNKTKISKTKAECSRRKEM